jgi:hypothetical protein
MKKNKGRSGKIETTLGELVEVITKIAEKSCHSKKESYQLASLTIEDILSHQTNPLGQKHNHRG